LLGWSAGTLASPHQDGQLAKVRRLSISPAQHVRAQFLTRWTQTEIIEINGLTEGRLAGNLHVRNLDDDLIARLKRRAARHGRSTEAEHREILRQVLAGEHEPSFEKLAADLRKLTKRRKQTPSEILLREGRDER
jgi:plasmid stability protein